MQTPPCPNARKFQHLLPTSSSITSDDVSARLVPWRSREDLRRCLLPAAQSHPHSCRRVLHLRRRRRWPRVASRRRPRHPPPQHRGTPRSWRRSWSKLAFSDEQLGELLPAWTPRPASWELSRREEEDRSSSGVRHSGCSPGVPVTNSAGRRWRGRRRQQGRTLDVSKKPVSVPSPTSYHQAESPIIYIYICVCVCV